MRPGIIPTPSPQPPEGLRIVEADGTETPIDTMTYLGPDPETGNHTFEATVPATIAPLSVRGIKLAKLPALTTVGLRFDHPGTEED